MTDKSIILTLFENLTAAINSVDGVHGVYVWNNQPDKESTEQPYEYPYCGIEISIDWDKKQAANRNSPLQRLAQNQQKGTATIKVHLIYESLKETTESNTETETLRHLMHRAIDGLENEQYSRLQRTSSEQDNNHDRVIDLITTYTTDVLESGIEGEKVTKTVTLDMTTDLDIDNIQIRTGDGQ